MRLVELYGLREAGGLPVSFVRDGGGGPNGGPVVPGTAGGWATDPPRPWDDDGLEESGSTCLPPNFPAEPPAGDEEEEGPGVITIRKILVVRPVAPILAKLSPESRTR